MLPECGAGSGWHCTHMLHTHCNYRGILNTGQTQLRENIKAEAGAEWLVLSMADPHTCRTLACSKKNDNRTPSTSDKSRDRQTCLRGEGEGRWGGGGVAPPYCCKSRRKKREEKEEKKERKKGNRSHTGYAPPAELYLHFNGERKRRYMTTGSSLHPASLICQPLVNQGW